MLDDQISFDPTQAESQDADYTSRHNGPRFACLLDYNLSTYIQKSFNYYIDEENVGLCVPSGILAIIVAVSYSLASGRDPGKLKPEPTLDFLELLQKFSPTDLCPDCEVIRTRRSRHCAICNVCVERYDHHCPWINNCVGVRNHNPFLAFLASTWLFAVTSIAIIITSILILIVICSRPGAQLRWLPRWW